MSLFKKIAQVILLQREAAVVVRTNGAVRLRSRWVDRVCVAISHTHSNQATGTADTVALRHTTLPLSHACVAQSEVEF